MIVDKDYVMTFTGISTGLEASRNLRVNTAKDAGIESKMAS